MKKSRKVAFVIIFSLLYILISSVVAFGVIYIIYSGAKVEINEDISKYDSFIGNSAREEYREKWGMDEEIFPQKIADKMDVKDYKMVYYNPWDAQYLSYLVVNYEAEEFRNEAQRLNSYKSTNYLGYYGVTGFSKYSLLAIYADPYNGFVYALTDNQSTIIYVELIFCNYFYDLDYKKYINEDYLPDGFDASLDNDYRKQNIEN